MPKEIKDMTSLELVEEFNDAAMHIHNDFGFSSSRREDFVEGRPNLLRHAKLKNELLVRLSTLELKDSKFSGDKDLVEELIYSLTKAFRDPILGPIMHIDSAKILRVEVAKKALLIRLKDLREVGASRRKPSRMAVAGRK